MRDRRKTRRPHLIKRAGLTIFSVLILAFGLSVSALAAKAENGTITGIVANGTAGEASIGGGHDVELLVSVNGQPGAGSAAKTDARGSFTFTGLSTDASYSYQVLAIHEGIHYISEAIAFAAGETSKSTEVSVYETTDSDASVSVVLGHVLFYQAKDVLQVKEYYLVVNTDDRTYTGSKVVTQDGQKQTMSLSLPKGATRVQYTNGLSDLTAFAGGDGLVTTLPIIPGMNNVGYTYQLKNSSSKYSFAKKIEQTIARIDIVAEGEQIGIAGEGLTTAEPLSIQGTMYAHATRENLKAGDILTAQLSGLVPGETQSMAPWVILALGVLAVVASAGYLCRRRREQPAPTIPLSDLDEGQRLLSELARLDDEFESGKISEQDYASLRADAKARLVEHLEGSERTGEE